jgi:hypothetical protein
MIAVENLIAFILQAPVFFHIGSRRYMPLRATGRKMFVWDMVFFILFIKSRRKIYIVF